MADPPDRPIQNNRFHPLSARPVPAAVLCFDSLADLMDLAETASHRLNAARRLLETTATLTLPDADHKALHAVSEAAFLLLSDGIDLFNALAFRGLPGGADTD